MDKACLQLVVNKDLGGGSQLRSADCKRSNGDEWVNQGLRFVPLWCRDTNFECALRVCRWTCARKHISQSWKREGQERVWMSPSPQFKYVLQRYFKQPNLWYLWSFMSIKAIMLPTHIIRLQRCQDLPIPQALRRELCHKHPKFGSALETRSRFTPRGDSPETLLKH